MQKRTSEWRLYELWPEQSLYLYGKWKCRSRYDNRFYHTIGCRVLSACPGSGRAWRILWHRGKTPARIATDPLPRANALDPSAATIRPPKEERERVLEKYSTTLYESHGAIMKEYVTVADNLLKKTDELKDYFDLSYEYIKTLRPKPAKKKSWHRRLPNSKWAKKTWNYPALI